MSFFFSILLLQLPSNFLMIPIFKSNHLSEYQTQVWCARMTYASPLREILTLTRYPRMAVNQRVPRVATRWASPPKRIRRTYPPQQPTLPPPPPTLSTHHRAAIVVGLLNHIVDSKSFRPASYILSPCRPQRHAGPVNRGTRPLPPLPAQHGLASNRSKPPRERRDV